MSAVLSSAFGGQATRLPTGYAVNQFGLLVGFLYLTLSLLLFFLLPLPLFLLFLKECGMERHDFRWRVNSRHSSSSS